MAPNRVLFLVDRLGRGGAAEVVVNSALGIDPIRYSPVVCVTRDMPSHEHVDILRQSGVPLILLKRKWCLDLFAWRHLRGVLSTTKILHSHESGSNFWGRILGVIFRIPIVIIQEHTASDEKPFIVRICDRLLKAFSDRVIAVSEHDRELLIHLEKYSPQKVVAIYNGIDLNKFDYKLKKLEARQKARLPKGKYLIAVIARLVHQKNHLAFFSALNMLSKEIKSDIHCLIVGGGKLEMQLRARVNQCGLQDIVSFLGDRGDVPTILRAIDLLVLSSHWECLPMIVLEALAAECPLVATEVGGIPEVLDSVGWPLVAPNDPLALATAIEQVFGMTEIQLKRTAELGKHHLTEKFSRGASVKQIEKLYDSLLPSVGLTSLDSSTEGLLKTEASD